MNKIIKIVHFFAQKHQIQKQIQKSSHVLTSYQDGILITKHQLVLQQKQDIQSYVTKLIKNYFRTQRKDFLTMDSELKQHGLDSLDSMQLAMQIEQDLGYNISAQNILVFSKPIHFVNFIQHTEEFKKEYGKSPIP